MTEGMALSHEGILAVIGIVCAAGGWAISRLFTKIDGIAGDHVHREEFRAVQQDYVGRVEFETVRAKIEGLSSILAAVQARQQDVIERLNILEKNYRNGVP